MGMSGVKNTRRYIVANTAAVIVTVFLGFVSLIGTLDGDGVNLAGTIAFTVAVILFSFLLRDFVGTISDYSKLAFFVPFILLVLNVVVLATNVRHGYFYLFVCLFICGISCLYTNFRQTLGYILLQTAVILLLFFLDFPVVGYDLPALAGLLGIFFIFMTSCLFLLVITKSTTDNLNTTTSEANSFRTYLATAKDYVAMLDSSNRIAYVSKPLSDLARIGSPELAKGRPFIDLFPSRELKVFASNMLGRRELHEENWEFVLLRQKRYFKVVSSGTVKGMAKGGTLISMLDMTHLAERDEIAAMKDSLKIGLFFMDRGFVIQDNYSRFLEELLSDVDLKGKCFPDLLAASLSAREIEAVKDYLGMVFDRTFDSATLQEINPLVELRYVNPLGIKKIFRCEFLTVDMGKGDTVVLVTIYDITVNIELQERLQKEERKRQEEMSNLFELLQVDPATFKAFQEDVANEFLRIDGVLGNVSMSNQEILVEVYQSVHAIKSNAVTIGLNSFGAKIHAVESDIKRMRNLEVDIPFDDMLHLTLEIERLVKENDGFAVLLEKINAFKAGGGAAIEKSSESILVESLSKTAETVAADTEKKVRFVVTEIDPEALEKGPRRVMKEALMQLVRNSVVHGVEPPDERVAKGKNETGAIRLSVKCSDKSIHIKLSDDGKGFDFDRIREKALGMNLITEEDADDRNKLLDAIFSPGFSTADEEGMHAGRGIGLNLVRDWVRAARGTIKLQTELGKGSAFHLFFPLENAATSEMSGTVDEAS